MLNLESIVYYQSKKTSEVFLLIKNSEGQVVLENADGKQTKISESTFKRWYAKTDKEIVLETLGAEKIQEMETEVSVEEELPPTKTDEEGREYIDFGKVEEAPSKPRLKRSKVGMTPVGSETGRIPAKAKEEIAGAIANTKQSNAEQKQQKRNTLLNKILDKAVEVGATYKVSTSNITIKTDNKNIAEIVGNYIYTSYSALPPDIFHSKNVSFTPEAWKWTLSVKVAISEETLGLIEKLLVAGKAYRNRLTKDRVKNTSV